jgi:hypothetical protein
VFRPIRRLSNSTPRGIGHAASGNFLESSYAVTNCPSVPSHITFFRVQRTAGCDGGHCEVKAVSSSYRAGT